MGSRKTWSHGPRDTMPSWYPHDAPRFVDLAPGETVSVEIDLTRHPACRLEGLLLLDGRALEPLREEVRLYLPRPAREALLELEGDPLFRARAPIGGDGRFDLAVDRPGTYRLRLGLPLPTGPSLVVLDRVELRPGAASWSLDLPTGSLAVRQGPGGDPWRHDLLHRWRGPGELRVFASFAWPDEERGLLVFPILPAGPGQLLSDPFGGPRRELAEVLVPPGGEALVELR